MSQAAIDKIRLWRERPDVFVRDVFGVTPDPWQDEILQAFPHKQRIAMVACKGPGKAQPKSLIIETPAGQRIFGSLMAGDFVFAEDGSRTIVKAVYDRGTLPMYRVHFDDGSYTDCCGEHLWKVRGRTERRHNRWSVINTKEIIRRGIRERNGRWAGRQFEIPQQGAARFTHKELPLDPYFMGVWIGDGSTKKAQFTNDALEVDQELVKRGFDIYRHNDGHGKNICISVYGILDRLRMTGLFKLNSHSRFIPLAYKQGSIQQRMDLLAGLMDTDGCIGDDGHMEFDSTSKELAGDVMWLVRSLGGVAFIKGTVKKPYYYDSDKKKVAGRDCFRVTVKTPFNPFKITKKSIRWKEAINKSQKRYLTRYIDRIEKIDPQDCMCIEVSHSSACYLTNDFIVTHNTALEAWLAWNFLLTRPYPKIAATSVTGDNLADNLWSELAKWQQKSELLKKMFTWTKTRIFANESPETWWMSARPWSKSANMDEQGNTLAGLHADYIMFILDESGSIPDAVMVSADAALSSCIEGHILQAGNPTMLSGPLYRAATSERRLWHVTHITADPDDPLRTPRVSVQWAKEQIEKYGRDNAWVLVNVFGQFPPASLNALIGIEEVRAATKRDYREQDYGSSARILGVDVALFGDDSSVIFPRQGLQSFAPLVYRNIDGTQGANLAAQKWREWEADACFVDNTGGFGSSWCDNLRRLGFSPFPVHFAEKPRDGKYFNKRAEMMFECVEWIKGGGAIPDRPELVAALTQTTYTFKGDKLMIEPKEVIKAKLGYSPDEMDALILTFAVPVNKNVKNYGGKNNNFTFDYDPLSDKHINGG